MSNLQTSLNQKQQTRWLMKGEETFPVHAFSKILISRSCKGQILTSKKNCHWKTRTKSSDLQNDKVGEEETLPENIAISLNFGEIKMKAVVSHTIYQHHYS